MLPILNCTGDLGGGGPIGKGGTSASGADSPGGGGPIWATGRCAPGPYDGMLVC